MKVLIEVSVPFQHCVNCKAFDPERNRFVIGDPIECKNEAICVRAEEARKGENK